MPTVAARLGRAGPKGGAHRTEPSYAERRAHEDACPEPGVRRFGRAAIIVAALVLVALAWVGARDAIRAHRGEARARVQAEVLATTQAIEEQLRRELLSLDQTLRILEYEWERDPDHFDLAARSGQAVVLSDVSLQLFIADSHGIVQASSRPAIIGTDVGNRDYFRHEASLAADDDKMFVGELTQGQITRLWQVNLVRRLDNPDGTFAGVIAASYDTNSFTRFYREVDLGTHGLIAVVSARDGNAWTMVGAGQAPTVIGIADTPIFAAMRQSPEGSWSGASGLDDVDRMYAFATVPDVDLKVVVGVDRAEAMRVAANWETNALLFTGGITLLILLLALLLLRAQDATRRRHDALAREQAILGATLTGMSDGLMMVDGDYRLMAWNQHFPEFTGVPAEILRVGTADGGDPAQPGGGWRVRARGCRGRGRAATVAAAFRRRHGHDRAGAAEWPAPRDQAQSDACRRFRHAVHRRDGASADRGAAAPGADDGGGRPPDRGCGP